jgi:hypothetical protein
LKRLFFKSTKEKIQIGCEIINLLIFIIFSTAILYYLKY